MPGEYTRAKASSGDIRRHPLSDTKEYGKSWQSIQNVNL